MPGPFDISNPFEPFRLHGGGVSNRPNAVMLNGSGFINCGSDAGLNNLPDGAFTAEGWFYIPTYVGSSNPLITKYGSGAGWYIYYFSQNLIETVINCATTDASGNVAPPRKDAWHHYAITWDDAGDRKVSIYLDGTLVETSDAGVGTIVSDAAKNYIIGGWTHSASYLPAGSMVGWNRVSNVIRYTINFVPDGRLSPPATDANTIGQWNMAEGTGATVDNAEGTAARDGTITGGTWVYRP